MNTPHLYFVPELIEWGTHTQTNHPEAGWIPARPLGFQGLSLRRRLSLAWGVFTGKYDAVYWEPTLADLHRNAMAVPEQHLPPKFVEMPPVWNQGEVNSAAAMAVAATNISPLEMGSVGCLPLVYYKERAVEENK
jgi:hypothetical protein